MHVSRLFNVTPLAQVLKLVALGPLLLITPTGYAQIIIENGATRTIDSSTPVDAYELRTGGQLIANGASTQAITADSGSGITLNGTTVTAQGTDFGIDLISSHATIAGNSKIFSARTALNLVGPSAALVSDSQINGGEVGAALGADSQLTLQSATVRGTNANGIGIASFGGKVAASNSTISGGLNGIQLYGGTALPASNVLVLNGTNVIGDSGSAIKVNGLGQANTQQLNIEINNGSTLKGGNGVLLEVNNGASTNFSVNNSKLSGDIIVSANSSADVLLDNFATLTGRLENVENLAVNNNALWVMVGDGQVQNLTLNSGGVQFGNPGQYFNLSVATLAGSGGTFYMHNDFTAGRVDTLTVAGNATGNHTIALDSQPPCFLR